MSDTPYDFTDGGWVQAGAHIFDVANVIDRSRARSAGTPEALRLTRDECLALAQKVEDARLPAYPELRKRLGMDGVPAPVEPRPEAFHPTYAPGVPEAIAAIRAASSDDDLTVAISQHRAVRRDTHVQRAIAAARKELAA